MPVIPQKRFEIYLSCGRVGKVNQEPDAQSSSYCGFNLPHMWYRMNSFQQKILGIVGIILFSFLFISILVESNLLKGNLEILAVAIIVVLIISFVIFLLSSRDFIQSQ